MVALIDDVFRVLAAAGQGDDARVRQLLARAGDEQVTELAHLIADLRVPLAVEVATRALRILSEPASA